MGDAIQIAITMLVYMLAVIGIGLAFARRSNASSDNYFLGGRTLGPWVTAMSAEASDMSGWLLMGLPGLAYWCGLADAAWTAIGLAVGTYINWLIVSRRLRRYSERAGNASLEEIVMALKTRSDFYQAETGINTKQIYQSSKRLSNITGVPIPPSKAIVGANAFAHESGIHQHGVIANAQTYEIMKSTDVGIPKNTMVLGKHSGKHALREKLESMGYELTDEELSDVFKNFKELADKKKTITGSDIEALVLNRRNTAAAACELVSHVVNAGDGLPNTSCVKIKRDDKVLQEVAIGSGPLDASFKAINRMLHMDVKLDSFSLNAVTDGEDAIGEAVVKISDESGKTFTGTGLSTDIIESSIRAYVNGINKMIDAAS